MIIAHKEDYRIFNTLLKKSVSQLQDDSKIRKEYYLGRGGTNLEKDVYKIINEKAKDTIYAGNIELISGQKFPDIVAYVNENKAFGLEVKTTNQNKWTSTGSSIFEGTRVDNVKKIHLLFGKLSNPIEFKCRKYEECLYNVAITHSPRYLIDMNINENESIFSKIGVDYNTLRNLENPFKPIKNFFRKNLKEGEDLWWIDNNNENIRNLEIKLWNNLPLAEKEELRTLALAYFPNLLSSNSKKYGRLATWLVSKYGIVNHALRDTFTAGGQVDIQGTKFPKIYKHLTDNLEKIYTNINLILEDDCKYYWEIEEDNFDSISIWKKLTLSHCKGELDSNQYKIIKEILGE